MEQLRHSMLKLHIACERGFDYQLKYKIRIKLESNSCIIDGKLYVIKAE
jgi:hypothetical protein